MSHVLSARRTDPRCPTATSTENPYASTPPAMRYRGTSFLAEHRPTSVCRQPDILSVIPTHQPVVLALTAGGGGASSFPPITPESGARAAHARVGGWLECLA